MLHCSALSSANDQPRRREKSGFSRRVPGSAAAFCALVQIQAGWKHAQQANAEEWHKRHLAWEARSQAYVERIKVWTGMQSVPGTGTTISSGSAGLTDV